MEPARRPSRPTTMSNRIARRVVGGLILALTLAACGGTNASPSPETTLRPTPTPVAGGGLTRQEAAALVMATNPLFADARELDPSVIGASRWWVASPLADGGYEIEVTVGWGDCPSGCISRHVWTFQVQPGGTITLMGETGAEVPAVLPG